MPTSPEDDLLRSVAIQNAQSILAAQQRAEQEILRAKDELEGKTRELARSLAIIRATLDSTWDGILVTGVDGTLIRNNGRFASMFGIPEEVLHTRDLRQVVDFVVEQATPIVVEGEEKCQIHHYSAPFSLPAKNTLLAVEDA